MRRVPAGLFKRLARVEQVRNVKRPRAIFPPIMAIDEWEAVAVASQNELANLTQELIKIERAPSLPQLAQQENTQAEHERLYREHRKQVEAGPRDYLEHKRQQVLQATTPK